MFTGKNVALLNQGIEKITRRAYARLEFICESNIYSVMVSAKPASRLQRITSL
jgi:hypothetical protein